VQPSLRRHVRLPSSADGNEIAEVSYSIKVSHASEVWHQPTSYWRAAPPELTFNIEGMYTVSISAALRAKLNRKEPAIWVPRLS